MSMTVSMFDAYYVRMPAVRASRMMDMAQASFYAQVTQEGRREIWNGWTNTISRVTQTAVDAGKALFTWNGEMMSISNLKRQFFSIFGRSSIE